MFLEIENQIINLDNVKRIYVDRTAQGIWTVKIEAEKGNILFAKDYRNEQDAIDFGTKFSDILKPIQLS